MIITAEAILEIITRKGVCSRGDIAKVLGCESETLKPFLQALKVNGQISQSGIKKGARYSPTHLGGAPEASQEVVIPVPKVPVGIPDINKRFSILSKVVKKVGTREANALIILGQGGTGKTGEVLRTLTEDLGLTSRSLGQTVDKDTEFLHVKGKVSAADVYKVLFENRDAVIVFDDCDSVLAGDGLNMLKSALDTYKVRTVSWSSRYIQGTMGLPESFEFRGSVIFVTNLSTVPQPLQSRGFVVNLTMSHSDLCDRMLQIGPQMMPHLTEEVHLEVVDFIRENAHSFKDMSLRTYIKVAGLHGEEGWQETALFTN